MPEQNNATTEILEKITKSVQSARENKTDEEYIGWLETTLSATITASLQSTMREQAQMNEVLGKIKEYLPTIEKDHKFLADIAIKSVRHAAKFSGKKVSKERLKIYGEIEAELESVRKRGAQGALTEAVRIVAKNHKKDARKLYKSYAKHKNLLYAK